MANQRAHGQQLLGFWADQELLGLIDDARGSRSRSQFLRDAIAAELDRIGVAFDRAITSPPDRARRGGKAKQNLGNEEVATLLTHNASGESEPIRVSPLTEIGPPKGQFDITEEARLASLEAQLPPGILDAMLEDALMEVANRGLRSPSTGEAVPPTPPGSQPPHVSRPASAKQSARKGKRAVT